MNRQSERAGYGRAALLLVGALVAASIGVAAPLRSESQGLQMADYFRLQRVVELAITDDGQWLAYAVSRGSIDSAYDEQLSDGERQSLREVRLHPLSRSGRAVAPEVLQDARAMAWIPGTRELAFLSSRSGRPQVFSYDTTTDILRQRTRAADPVEAFRFAPDGQQFAYLTRAQAAPSASFYHQLHNGQRGILVDTDVLSVYDFVNPRQEQRVHPKPALLWVQNNDEPPVEVPIPGALNAGSSGFFWSSDSKALSVTYVADTISQSLFRAALTSVGVYEHATREFLPIVQGKEIPGAQAGVGYTGGEWIPHERKLLVRRASSPDLWLRAFQTWAVLDLTAGSLPPEDAWRPMEVNDGALFRPVSAAKHLVEDADQGVRALFELTADGLRPAKKLLGVAGSHSLVRFSADFSTVAFVNESLTRAPEIYVRQGEGDLRPVTTLNTEINRRVRFTAREVQWTSNAGVRVHGWLLMPPSADGKGPWPLITHVHGGPGFPYTDAFAPYFQVWPYPFELLAERGVAVFLPNYRGTSTYGRTIASPSRLDGEPVADIVSGIEHLIAAGVADPARLGITGHSHGAWLAPIVMARHQLFEAASFAEGTSNQVLNYLMMPGELNRWVHDPKSGQGSSLYENWRPYVEASADLHFQDVRSASLWEGGAQSLAVLMMAGAKGTRRAGAPTEFVIYPRTGHNLHLPNIQRESAERNLEWFAFWLQGEELRADEKPEQYIRWRALREQQRNTAKALHTLD